LWLLEIENSLVAIDPLIEGLPYWDTRQSVNVNDSPFTEAYFGPYQGTDTKHQVLTGPFARWPIYHISMSDPSTINVVNADPTNDEIENASVNITLGVRTILNVFGYLRSPISFNSARYLTRNGWSICGIHVNFACSDSDWDLCLQPNVSPNIQSWYKCIESRIHSPPHMAIAGSWERFPLQSQNDNCVSWFGHLDPPKAAKRAVGMAFPGSFINPYSLNCFRRPKNCTVSHTVTGRFPVVGSAKMHSQTTCAFVPRGHYCGPLWTGIESTDKTAWRNCANSTGYFRYFL
jgi:hypothetical protein